MLGTTVTRKTSYRKTWRHSGRPPEPTGWIQTFLHSWPCRCKSQCPSGGLDLSPGLERGCLAPEVVKTWITFTKMKQTEISSLHPHLIITLICSLFYLFKKLFRPSREFMHLIYIWHCSHMQLNILETCKSPYWSFLVFRLFWFISDTSMDNLNVWNGTKCLGRLIQYLCQHI